MTQTFITQYRLGDKVQLSPHWPGDVPLTTPWFISGIHVTALDNGQRYTYYTVADGPKTQKVRQYLTSVHWTMLEIWKEAA